MIPQTKKVIKGFLKLFILKMFPTKVCFENYNKKVGFCACSKLIAGMPIRLIFLYFLCATQVAQCDTEESP